MRWTGGGTVAFLDEQTAFHRVDAARRRMHIPATAAEASGQLHMAKATHEATKRGPVGTKELEEIFAGLAPQLSEVPRRGAQKELAWFLESLDAIGSTDPSEAPKS